MLSLKSCLLVLTMGLHLAACKKGGNTLSPPEVPAATPPATTPPGTWSVNGSAEQGGFEKGAYAAGAVQPTSFQWVRQSPYQGPARPTLQWRFDVPDTLPSGGMYSAIGSDGTLYWGAKKGLYAITPAGQGRRLSEVLIDYSAPVLGAGGAVYVWCNNALCAFDAQNGQKRWELKTNDYPFSPALGSDGTVYIQFAGALRAVNGEDGTVKWSFPNTEDHLLLGASGDIYTTVGQSLVALNRAGQQQWACPFEDYPSVKRGVIDSNGDIYVTSSLRDRFGRILHNRLHVVTRSGQKKWTYELGADFGVSGMAMDAQHVVYVSSFMGKLFAIDPSGALKWSFQHPEINALSAPPLIDASGMIYANSGLAVFSVDAAGQLRWLFKIPHAEANVPIGVAGDSALSLGAGGHLYIGVEYNYRGSFINALLAIGDPK